MTWFSPLRDDGVGMSDERLHTLLPEEGPARPQVQSVASATVQTTPRTASPSRLPRRRGRVGVRNVHERIQLYFGAGYGLSFDHNNGAGTVVEVRLPVITGDDAEGEEGDGA